MNDYVIYSCQKCGAYVSFYYNTHKGVMGITKTMLPCSLWGSLQQIFMYFFQPQKSVNICCETTTFSPEDVNSLAGFFNKARGKNFSLFPEMAEGMEKD